MVEPPSIVGATHVRSTCALSAVVVRFVGASGTVTGVTELEEVDGTDEPATFVATTVNVYAVPLTNPE